MLVCCIRWYSEQLRLSSFYKDGSLFLLVCPAGRNGFPGKYSKLFPQEKLRRGAKTAGGKVCPGNDRRSGRTRGAENLICERAMTAKGAVSAEAGRRRQTGRAKCGAYTNKLYEKIETQNRNTRKDAEK